MRRVAAPLAAALCALAAAGCGGGAEPGAPQGATLVLDFTPNAVHAGLYAAQHRGYFREEGVELEIREPSESSDGIKLLVAGRADYAILDINDLGIAIARGARLRPLAGLVDRALGSVIAAEEISRPRELEGATVGVTGLPSDEAVLETVVAADGGDPERVRSVNVGFNAVAALAGGRVDAVTAFWNAEGVALRENGVATSEFRVDEFGAPRFPELILVSAADGPRPEEERTRAVLAALRRGYLELREDPAAAVDDLLAEVPELDRGQIEAEQEALLPAFAEDGLLTGIRLRGRILNWSRWATEHGVIEQQPVRDFAPLLQELGG